MMRTFFILLTQRLPRGRQPKPEEVKAAIEQLKDVNRMAGLLVLASMPGSVITLPLLCKLANRYGIEIMPSAFQDKTTMVETLNGLAEELGPRFRPVRPLKLRVRAGHLGESAGKGFHEYV